METQLTVRLPADLTGKIKQRAKQLRLKKADIVRQALVAYLEGPEETDRPYDRVKHLIGSVHSGIGDFAARRDEIIRTIRQHNFRD